MIWSQAKPLVIAVLSDEPGRRVLIDVAEHRNWRLQILPDCGAALALLKQHPAAVVLYDRDLPQCDWRTSVAAIMSGAPQTRVILTSPWTDDNLWLDVLGRGGFDVVTRPFHERRLHRYSYAGLGRDQEITPFRTA